MNRPIFKIAKDIKSEWGSKVYFGAAPYLEAMQFLSNKNDKYGFDNGETILRYFLSNASTFRGETARKLKEEIKNILAE
jgi:hypothetical protein